MVSASRFKNVSVLAAIAAWSFLCISGTAYPAVHELVLAAPVLVENDPSCADQATSLARAFAEKSGSSLIEVTCGHDRIGSPAAIIKYSAPASVNVFNPNAAMFDLYAIGFKSAEECSEVLAREIPLFVQHTGLQPFASYCHLDPTMGASRQFRTAIYAINNVGQVPGRKFSTGTQLDNPPVDPAAVSAAAFEMGRLAGIDMVWTGVGQGFSTLQLTATYYGTGQLNLHSASLGYINPQVSCDDMTTNLNSQWTGKGAIDTHFFCMNAGQVNFIGPDLGPTTDIRRLGIFWWSSKYINDEDFTVTSFATNYADLATCESAREAAVANLTAAGETVLASLCSHAAYPYPKRPLPPMQVTVITR